MLYWRTFLLGTCMAALGACSSSSTTDNSGGSGGSSSGDTGGTGANGTGGTATGGSGGTAGATGGAAGTTASGGAAGAGASGGADGGTANPGCQPLCDAIVAASCSKGPTMQGCLWTCKTLTSSSTCDPKAEAYFDCVKTNGVQCDAAGNPTSKTCGIAWLQAINCATTENPNPAMVGPCNTYCDKVVAANCQLNGTKDECSSNCKWLGATGTGCDDEWGAFLTCANSASFNCVLGFATAQGCGSEFTAYTKCANAAGKP